MNPYRVLGLAPTATAAEIRDAYRRRAKLTHPDAGGSAAEFDRLTAAYDTLADPGRRFAFDRAAARDDATSGPTVDEHRHFEEMWQPSGRRRDRNSSRVGNFAVSIVGGAALAVAALVLRFGGDSKPGPPTPVSCAAVRTVSATFEITRIPRGNEVAVRPRVTLHNAGADLAGARVGFTISLRTAGRPATVFGRSDEPIWAGRGRSVGEALSTSPALVVPATQPVDVVSARASATTVSAAATALPSGGCPIPVTAA